MRILSSGVLLSLLCAAMMANASNEPNDKAESVNGHSHWGYSGHAGPEHWAELSGEFSTCSNGLRQSPIDISGAEIVKAQLSEIQFHYRTVNPEIINNGHTIQVNYPAGSTMTVGGETYELVQFHFHSPSENTVAGKPYAMEMHLVHKNTKGELAVIAVFLKNGVQNDILQAAWDKMPTNTGDQAKLGTTINAVDLLPSNRVYSHFNGSLTTPPCSEGVNWYVMQQPVEVSAQQIARFTLVIGHNARPVQALNKRFVLANQ